MMSTGFQGKSFNITVIYNYSSTTDAEEAEGDWFCEDLQHLLQLQKKKKNVLFITGDWNAKWELKRYPE